MEVDNTYFKSKCGKEYTTMYQPHHLCSRMGNITVTLTKYPVSFKQCSVSGLRYIYILLYKIYMEKFWSERNGVPYSPSLVEDKWFLMK